MKKKLCAVSILLAALMGTMMTGCTKPDTDAAVTNTENVTFTATPSQNQIEVKMEDGSVQKLKLGIEKDLYDPTKMIVDDYNFDGYQDIAFPYDYNEHNINYQLWLYHAENGQFEEYASFPDYYNPTLDAETKTISTVCYSNEVTTSWGKYDWRDGELFCLELKTEAQDDNGETITSKWVYNEETKQLEVVTEE